MKKWKNLINTFNNLVFIKKEGNVIHVRGSVFALEGFRKKLSTINKPLYTFDGGVGIFNCSFVAYKIETRNNFFNN